MLLLIIRPPVGGDGGGVNPLTLQRGVVNTCMTIRLHIKQDMVAVNKWCAPVLCFVGLRLSGRDSDRP